MAEKKKAATKKAAKKAAGKKAAPKRRSSSKPDASKKEKFVESVARHGNQARAAQEAGWEQSDAAAAVTGSRLMADPEVRARVDAKRRESLAHYEVERREVIGTVAAHLRGDLADVFTEDELLRAAKAAGVSRNIKKLKVTTDTHHHKDGTTTVTVTREVELHDPQRAGQLLGKWLGMEKAEGQNPEDVEREERNRAWAEEQLRRVMLEMNLTRDEAAALIRERAPTVSQWLM